MPWMAVVEAMSRRRYSDWVNIMLQSTKGERLLDFKV